MNAILVNIDVSRINLISAGFILDKIVALEATEGVLSFLKILWTPNF
jgi:hypothetical protein